MKINVESFHPNDVQAVNLFYQCGDRIRKPGDTAFSPWHDERNIEQIFSHPRIEGKLFIATNQNFSARVAAYYNTANSANGFVGWYESSQDETISTTILNEATDWLKRQGCKSILGPINGTTWNNYRFNMGASYPLFPGDPCQPIYYPEFWKSAGFVEFVNYVTEVPPRDAVRPTSINDVKNLLGTMQLSLQHITPEIGERYLEKLHAFYNLCFADNPLFYPIGLEAYKSINDKVTSVLNADHSFLVTDQKDQIVGVFISFQDLYHKLFSHQVDAPSEYKLKRLVIKTLAVHPDYRSKQIGTLCINLIHHCAYENGFDQVVHALMYVDNLSATKGREKFKTQEVRRYSLLKKQV